MLLLSGTIFLTACGGGLAGTVCIEKNTVMAALNDDSVLTVGLYRWPAIWSVSPDSIHVTIIVS